MADIYGKIIAVLPTRSGVSARGNQWSSQTCVIETQEQYPRMVAFDVFGDKINEFNIQVGEFATVSYDVRAREFEGRWFNSVQAWRVVKQQPDGGGGLVTQPQPTAQPLQPPYGSTQPAQPTPPPAGTPTDYAPF